MKYGKAILLAILVGNPEYGRIDTNLEEGIPVIVKVLIDHRIPHWVLIVGKEGGEYLINDPLGAGKTAVRLSVYGEKIYALRVYRRSMD